MIPDLEGLLERGTKFPHPIGIVINGGAKIGKNCTIWQNVTIGVAFSKRHKREFPIICDNVQIYANSVVLGGITIGNNAIVGAGSVVIDDVPDGATVAGNPARIIK
ncbi:MAG: serine acetyltransferase [Alphaproteobacteria bacterium]|nr:serine acetyltransferase [Alphaproteobacteria bacterium]